MINLLILILVVIFMSCSTFDKKMMENIESPGYQYGRQMDERSLRTGFMER
jgi:hypothetical protein